MAEQWGAWGVEHYMAQKKMEEEEEERLAALAAEEAQEYAAQQAMEMSEFEAGLSTEAAEREAEYARLASEAGAGYATEQTAQEAEYARQAAESGYEFERLMQELEYGAAEEAQAREFGYSQELVGYEAQLEEEARAASWERMMPYLEEFLGDDGDGGGDGRPPEYGGAVNPYISNVVSGLQYQGARQQEELVGSLAGRGVFRSGAMGAASARLSGEVASQVAGAEAGYAEAQLGRASEERMARERILADEEASRRQALAGLLAGLG